MSQEALAESAGLAAKHVSEIERANRDVRFTTFVHLAAGLGLSATELMALYERQVEAR